MSYKIVILSCLITLSSVLLLFSCPVLAQVEFSIDDNTSSTETNKSTDQFSFTDINPKLAITSFKIVSSSLRSSIIGEVMNNTTTPIQSVHITGSVYNLKDQLVATGDTIVDIDQLRPGEKAGFEILLHTKVTAGKRATLSTDYQLADLIKPGFLKITIGKLHEENRRLSDYERFTVVGEVTNLGPDVSSNVKVVGLFFDKKHNLVDYDYGRLKSDPLSPGQKGPFELSVFSKNAGKIDSVSLNVQGDEYSMAIENKQK